MMQLRVYLVVGLTLTLNGLCSAQETQPFTIDDFLSGRFSSRGYSGHWISDSEIQTVDGGGNVIVINVATNTSNIILPSNVLSNVSANTYDFSSDRQYVLISYDTQSQFRHSTTARYTVYSIASRTYAAIANGSFLQTAHWGPNGHSLLYIQDNDIYYTSDIATKSVSRVTTSGVPGVIYNGVPDWVYEEEVLAASTAYWFSPDGANLLFLEFNDTLVPEMTYMKYGQPGTIQDQYPTKVTIRYPKAGATNPSHTAYIVKLTDSVLRPLPIRQDATGSTVTYGLSWVSNTLFTEEVMNREQSSSTVTICDVDTSECRELLSETNDRGWVRQRQRIFDDTQSTFITIQSKLVSSSETYSHLAVRSLSQSVAPIFLTDGDFNVQAIVGWDQTSSTVYFTGTVAGFPSRTQVYRVSSNGGLITCITCNLVSPENNPCTSASARYSTSYTYVILTCSAPDPTTISLYRNGATLQLLYDLETNGAVRDLLKTKSLPSEVYFVAPLPDGFLAPVRLLLPPNFDLNKTYPLLVNVYGGPDYNQVLDGSSVGWETYLTSSLNIIYAYIDGRGSGRQSDELLFANYRALGTSEIIDQINVTRWIQQNVLGVNASSSAIWGWSYGGYATGRALELDTEGVFKCGISVAPVSSWLYYDSIYTERYMGLPTESDNLEAYNNGDLLSNVDNLKNKQYYLIHGNGDDNVHYQQSMLFSRALELKDVIFQQQSYPDENHSLGGVSRHLYHSMDKFWKNCFGIA